MSAQASLLLLALLMSVSATAQPNSPACTEGIRRIELGPEPTGESPEVCIGSRQSTMMVFYGAEFARDGVTLEGWEHFTRVEAAGTVLRLDPAEHVVPGERFRLTLRFSDGAAPASATFWLVVHPTRLEPLVEVQVSVRRAPSVGGSLQA